MMAESDSIHSVEYVTYNYSVKRPELFICMLHFPDPSIRFDSIRFDSIRSDLPLKSDRIGLTRMGDRIDPIRSEVQIGSGSVH